MPVFCLFGLLGSVNFANDYVILCIMLVPVVQFCPNIRTWVYGGVVLLLIILLVMGPAL